MNINLYCAVFEVLGFEPRLRIFNWIVQAGDKGVAPKEIIEKFGFDSGTLSFHLKKLQKVNLIIKISTAGIRYYVSPAIPTALENLFFGDYSRTTIDNQGLQLALI